MGRGDSPPAGFWIRAAAWSIDAVVITPLALLLAWPWLATAFPPWLESARSLMQQIGAAMGAAIVDGVPLPGLALALMYDPRLAEATAALHVASWRLVAPAIIAFALVGALWNVGGEHSRWQGSAGKRLLGLGVVDRDGGPPGVGRSLGRHVAGAASWLTLNLGHALAAAAPEHLALHDRLSRTRVVASERAPARLPGWARAWLVVIAAAGFALTAWLANAASALMLAGLEQALY